jgi:hypothetical protein
MARCIASRRASRNRWITTGFLSQRHAVMRLMLAAAAPSTLERESSAAMNLSSFRPFSRQRDLNPYHFVSLCFISGALPARTPAAQGRSMAELVAEAASKYVDYSNREPEQIELEGEGVKRRFKGHRLYWFQDYDNQQGVVLTAKRNIAYWNYVPRTNPENRVSFEVYEDLDELFENQEWLAERHKGKPNMKFRKNKTTG